MTSDPKRSEERGARGQAWDSDSAERPPCFQWSDHVKLFVTTQLARFMLPA